MVDVKLLLAVRRGMVCRRRRRVRHIANLQTLCLILALVFADEDGVASTFGTADDLTPIMMVLAVSLLFPRGLLPGGRRVWEWNRLRTKLYYQMVVVWPYEAEGREDEEYVRNFRVSIDTFDMLLDGVRVHGAENACTES